MSEEKEYHGVPYILLPGEALGFLLRRGEISKKRFGTWEMGIEKYKGQDSCGCRDHVFVSPCLGKRVPHVFFACPYCGRLNADHRHKSYLRSFVSLGCSYCWRHLWIRFRGWDDKYWDEVEKGEKACGANSKS